MKSDADSELSIRVRRAAFNRALAEADLDTIGSLLAPDAILVTGTDSAVISGRRAQLLRWKRGFTAHERVIYTRTPGDIIVSPVEPIAMEYGIWQGVTAADVHMFASGRYTAKWRCLGGHWVIEAEVYLTLA